jgi:hypothetical protein
MIELLWKEVPCWQRQSKDVNFVDNLPGQIQVNVQRMQQEGAKHAASLFGAAASGKLDEEISQRNAEPEEKVDIGREKAAVDGKDTAAGSREMEGTGMPCETAQQDEGSDPSPEEILRRGADILPESLEAAGAMVRAQVAEKEKKEELSRMKPLGEPKLLDMRLEESIKLMDIHDLYSCKPLPPIMDDDPMFGEHIGGAQEQ